MSYQGDLTFYEEDLIPEEGLENCRKKAKQRDPLISTGTLK